MVLTFFGGGGGGGEIYHRVCAMQRVYFEYTEYEQHIGCI